MAALCEYVYKEFTVLVSTSWDNLALFTPMRFWFHMGINWKHLNVYSSFYTEMKKNYCPSIPATLKTFDCTLQVQGIYLNLNSSDVVIRKSYQ